MDMRHVVDLKVSFVFSRKFGSCRWLVSYVYGPDEGVDAVLKVGDG